MAARVGAQITLDGSLGPKGALQGPDYTIGADLGTQRGGNLFHSFGDFNIHRGESATFTGPGSVDNIIGRVTGGNVSSIDGRLASDIPGADVYLINPAGVMFGPDGTLDVKGSFNVSTADYLRLADGARFDARAPVNGVLSAAPPEAFGFLGQGHGGVGFDRSNISVPEGETLRIVGGNIGIAGATLSAPNGRIDLATAPKAGEVIPRPAIEPDPIRSSSPPSGEISISDGASVVTSGDGGGAIFIRGGHFEVDGSTLVADTTGAADGRGIDIRVESMELRNEAEIATSTSGTGAGGALSIAATDSIELTDTNHEGDDARPGGIVSMALDGQGTGNGGSISVSAPTIRLDNGAIAAVTLGSGRTGDVDVAGTTIRMTNHGFVSANTEGSGAGGAVRVASTDSIEISRDESGIFASALGEGNHAGTAGTIQVSTARLILSDGGQIISGTEGPGSGGSIDVVATDSIRISGEDSEGFDSGIYGNTQSETSGAGDAGSVHVSTSTLVLSAGGSIGSTTFGPGNGGSITVDASESIDVEGEDSNASDSGIVAYTQGEMSGAGNAGPIHVSTTKLRLSGGATIGSSTFGEGNGGAVSVNATQSIVIGGEDSEGFRSAILASALSEMDTAGDAGSISISTRTLDLTGGGHVVSGTIGPGYGGSVSVSASESIDIGSEGKKFGAIVASSEGQMPHAGNAGQVTISTARLTLSDGGAIESGSQGPGDGGSIAIDATEFVRISGEDGAGRASVITASVAGQQQDAGDGGSIRVSTRALTMSTGGTIQSISIGPGNGGPIQVDASDSIAISGTDSGGGSSGIFADAQGTTHEAGDAGPIRISTGSLSLADTGAIQSGSFGPGNGGSIDVEAHSIVISGQPNGSSSSRILAGAQSTKSNAGNAGPITIVASTLTLLDGGSVQNSSQGSGNAGSIAVQADSIVISGEGDGGQASAIFSDAQGQSASAGHGGSIRVSTSRLMLDDGGAIETATTGPGRGGSIEVDAKDVIEISGEGRDGAPTSIFAQTQGRSEGAGDAGTISISTAKLLMTAGGEINNSSFGQGAGGSIDVEARQGIDIRGQSGIFADSESEEVDGGDAGSITVATSALSIVDGAAISTDTSGGGTGGEIEVRADESISMTGAESGIFSTSSSPSPFAGGGGTVDISTSRLTLGEGASIAAESAGLGAAGSIAISGSEIQLSHASLSVRSGSTTKPGGSIFIHASKLFRTDDSSVTAEAAIAQGGNVEIEARDIQLLDGSGVTASVTGGGGGGGDVTMTAETIVAAEDSDIVARAVGGPGGNITANANVFLRCPECEVDASSQFSEQGTVAINSPDTNLAGVLARLPESFLSVDDLLSRNCARGANSSFVVRGADGLPPAPDIDRLW